MEQTRKYKIINMKELMYMEPVVGLLTFVGDVISAWSFSRKI